MALMRRSFGASSLCKIMEKGEREKGEERERERYGVPHNDPIFVHDEIVDLFVRRITRLFLAELVAHLKRVTALQ